MKEIFDMIKMQMVETNNHAEFRNVYRTFHITICFHKASSEIFSAAMFILSNLASKNVEWCLPAWCLYWMSCVLCFKCFLDDRHADRRTHTTSLSWLVIIRRKCNSHCETWLNVLFTVWVHALAGLRAGREIHVRIVGEISVNVVSVGRVCMCECFTLFRLR